MLEFPPYRIDRDEGRLWRGAEEVALRRKAWEVLLQLVERPGALITKNDLLTKVWGGTKVREAVITNCVSELRRALGDDRAAPQFIEIVHGRGFRWIATEKSAEHTAAPVGAQPVAYTDPVFVGRQAELASLRACWEAVLAEQRQLVLVSGDAGFGKSTLVERFLATLPANESRPYFLRGQCMEFFADAEPYVPLLDALARLCVDPSNALVGMLQQCAPTWLAQIPWLLDSATAQSIERAATGATKERMLRELATALDKMAAQRGLVIVLEDLHWADRATLEFVSFLSRRDSKMRLLLLATHRCADAPRELLELRQQLLGHNGVTELALAPLSLEEVRAYLDRRISGGDEPASLARAVLRHTGGHPMFMNAVVEELIRRSSPGTAGPRSAPTATSPGGSEPQLGLPDSLKRLIDGEIERLDPDDVQILEAASIGGLEVSSMELAGALGLDPGAIEDRCERIVQRRQILRDAGVVQWPDGSRGMRYAFAHGLYQRALYERLSSGRRQRLHRSVALRIEQAHRKRPAEVATQLAAHFEAAGDAERASHYLVLSGLVALRRASPHAARARFKRALEMAAQLEPGPVRRRRETAAWSGTADALIYQKGLADPAVHEAFERVEALAAGLDQPEDVELLVEVLYSAWAFHYSCADVARGCIVADRLTQLAERHDRDESRLCALTAAGTMHYQRGELDIAQRAFERALRLPCGSRETVMMHVPRYQALSFRAQVECLRGNIETAVDLAEQAAVLARDTSHSLGETLARYSKTVIFALIGNLDGVAAEATVVSHLSERYSLPIFAMMGQMLRTWLKAREKDAEALAALGGIESMLRTLGYESGALVVEWLHIDALVHNDRAREAIEVSDGLLRRFESTGVRCLEAEIYRLRGEAIRRSAEGTMQEAERSLRQAIEIAERQGARLWESRARESLSRLVGETASASVG